MLSVVIPAYNEASVIETCLEAFLRQTTTQPFEIILVDNNSSDNMLEKANRYKNRLPLKIVHEKKKGRGSARRTGFLTAQGKIILSTDADSIVPPDWIETMASHFEDSSIIAATGTGKIIDRTRMDNAFFNFFQPVCMRAYRLAFGHYWLTGFNFAITKDAYHKAGGFNADLNTQEDIELSFRVRKIGKITFVKNTPVTVSGRRYKKGVIIGLFPYLSTFIEYFLFKKTQILLSDPR